MTNWADQTKEARTLDWPRRDETQLKDRQTVVKPSIDPANVTMTQWQWPRRSQTQAVTPIVWRPFNWNYCDDSWTDGLVGPGEPSPAQPRQTDWTQWSWTKDGQPGPRQTDSPDWARQPVPDGPGPDPARPDPAWPSPVLTADETGPSPDWPQPAQPASPARTHWTDHDPDWRTDRRTDQPTQAKGPIDPDPDPVLLDGQWPNCVDRPIIVVSYWPGRRCGQWQTQTAQTAQTDSQPSPVEDEPRYWPSDGQRTRLNEDWTLLNGCGPRRRPGGRGPNDPVVIDPDQTAQLTQALDNGKRTGSPAQTVVEPRRQLLVVVLTDEGQLTHCIDPAADWRQPRQAGPGDWADPAQAVVTNWQWAQTEDCEPRQLALGVTLTAQWAMTDPAQPRLTDPVTQLTDSPVDPSWQPRHLRQPSQTDPRPRLTQLLVWTDGHGGERKAMTQVTQTWTSPGPTQRQTQDEGIDRTAQ